MPRTGVTSSRARVRPGQCCPSSAKLQTYFFHNGVRMEFRCYCPVMFLASFLSICINAHAVCGFGCLWGRGKATLIQQPPDGGVKLAPLPQPSLQLRDSGRSASKLAKVIIHAYRHSLVLFLSRYRYTEAKDRKSVV